MKKITLCFLFVLAITSCDRTTLTEHRDITALVQGISNLPAPPDPHPKEQIGTTPITVTENGIEYFCTEKKYSFANNMNEVIAFNPNAGTLYPGSLVQGKYVKDGILNSIGNFKRAPLKITLENYGGSQEIKEPSSSTVTTGILDLIRANNIQTIAKISYQEAELYSTEQAMLDLGIDYAWTAGSVGSTFSTSNSVAKSSIIIAFTQEFYTVSIEQPTEASDFFDRSVSADDLKTRVTDGNPLCYLSSVTYGRILYAKITADATMSELKTALSAALSVGASGTVQYTQNNTIKKSDIKVYALGGNAQDAIAAATGGMDGIKNFLNNNANFNIDNLGVPISYTVRHASDNTLVRLGNALEYTVNDECYYDPNSYNRFMVTIDRFHITEDCDALLAGAGEFKYSLEILDNNLVRRQLASTDVAQLNDGDDWNLSAGPYEIIVANQPGHKLIIRGCLSEQDDIWYDHCWPDIEFQYPFNDITTTPTSWVQNIDGGSGCQSQIYFTVSKVQ